MDLFETEKALLRTAYYLVRLLAFMNLFFAFIELFRGVPAGFFERLTIYLFLRWITDFYLKEK